MLGVYSKEIFRTITVVKIPQANILANWQNKIKHLAYTYRFCPAQDKARTGEENKTPTLVSKRKN